MTEKTLSRIIVMGVSGSGKSSVGEALAERIGVAFVDADDLHPESNVAKMSQGEPLTDDDRWPWLRLVGRELAEASDGMVIACSALKRSYRDAIDDVAPGTVFVHLHGEEELLAERIGGRQNHFMPSTLLASQLATLERLEPDENGFDVNIAGDVDSIVDDIAARLN